MIPINSLIKNSFEYLKEAVQPDHHRLLLFALRELEVTSKKDSKDSPLNLQIPVDYR